MFQIQRIVIECDDNQIQIGKEGSESTFAQFHRKLYPLFRRSRKNSWRKSTDPLEFSALFDDEMIQDQKEFCAYLQFVLQAAGIAISVVHRTAVLLIVPSTTLDSNKTIWAEICDEIGLGEVTFCSRAIAGAVGAGFSFPLLTFVPVLSLGWSSSEFTGVSFDSSVFSKDLEFSGKEVKRTVAAEAFRQQGIECSEDFWENAFRHIGDFITSDEATVATLYREMLSSEKKTLPFEWLRSQLLARIETMLLQVQMKMVEFTPSQLAQSTGQGIVLIGDLSSQISLSTYFSGRLSVPVYSLPDQSYETIRGGLSIFSALTKKE